MRRFRRLLRARVHNIYRLVRSLTVFSHRSADTYEFAVLPVENGVGAGELFGRQGRLLVQPHAGLAVAEPQVGDELGIEGVWERVALEDHLGVRLDLGVD